MNCYQFRFLGTDIIGQINQLNNTMNRNSPTISPTSTFKRYQTAFNKDKDNKLVNSHENFNSNFWRTQNNLQPSYFNILTPSPLPNFSIPNIPYDEKTKRFEDWPLSDMCLNPNVNRNMQVMIQKKLNFGNSDNEDEDNQMIQEIQQEKRIERKKSLDQKQQKQQREIKVVKPKLKNDSQNFQYYFARDNRQKKVRPKDKGLRRLSEKSFEIVQILKSTSYKQVAIKLISQLENQSQMYRQEKQQQNIKRRVYDALNVLIALGILRKQGREIIYDKNNTKYKKRNEQVFENIKKQKNSVKQRVERKRKQLIALKQKEFEKQLNIRNMKNDSQKKINIPFLTVFLQHNQNKQKMQQEEQKQLQEDIERQYNCTQTILKFKNKKMVKYQQSKNLMKFIKL